MAASRGRSRRGDPTSSQPADVLPISHLPMDWMAGCGRICHRADGDVLYLGHVWHSSSAGMGFPCHRLQFRCVSAGSPKQLLFLMLFFFMLMPKNRLLGLLAVPLPNFLDELFFLPFIAVIVMNWIQRRQLKEATLFPVMFCLIGALSWYVNGRPAPFTAVQVTLVMLKFYILWYFCRLTSTFENSKQLARWIWAYIVYVAIQFFYNMLWQRGPWPRYHPDMSGGVMGPEGQGSAHLIGYMCAFALFLLAGWWISSGRHATHRQRGWWWALTTVIAYNLIFMTDTKHALLLMPLAFLPFLFHPSLSIRLRARLAGRGRAVYFCQFFLLPDRGG